MEGVFKKLFCFFVSRIYSGFLPTCIPLFLWPGREDPFIMFTLLSIRDQKSLKYIEMKLLKIHDFMYLG